MSLIKQRQGRFLHYQLIQGLNGKLRYESVYEKKPFRNMTIAKTLNTYVTCRVCTGAGIITNVDSIGMYLDSICPHCNGSKQMISI